jgi:genome maintenance exonuclease 1
MKKYTFEPFPELSYSSIKGIRFYEVNGQQFPSITTAIGRQRSKQAGLQQWRDRVGEDAAKHISRTAAIRGTAFHTLCEEYVNGNDIEHLKSKHFLAWHMFGELKSHINEHLDGVVLQETTMYSDEYKVAGRSDLIAEWDGKLSIVDYKTTTKMKKPEWIQDYFVQCTAYAKMFEEHTGYSVDDLVIAMVAEDGQVEIFKSETKLHLERLEEIMEEFYDSVFKELAA